ncbi:exodeoxyribonuclease V subunit gamma [Psychrobacter urativorans]|uniref:Exodeoxyribonuclease V subunit gamma n=1 Tax=Psychrobacter urativorans TaxID=45610 RepID=A0A0M4T0U6_9GAMM|nr:exodeoxyribonuclease V subunit gamma [Psychrobacter urativorans]ALF58815.1 exodeoxyribonuclease V subunit gamma [Psychrobacter urativorans]
MFTIIQSHRTEILVEQLLSAYKSKNQPIFEEFIVIVPSMVLGEWLDKSIASQAGISTLVTTTFWGQYQWTLMQKVLAEYNTWLETMPSAQDILTVPEVAVLTGSVMQWRLFGYFTYYQTEIMANDAHPLYPLLSALLDGDADRSQQDIRLWSLATDFSRVFSRYLNHREAWLDLWSDNKAVDVEAMVAAKDELTIAFDKYAGKTPDWLVAHYTELEAAQRHLWHLLFAAVYKHRAAIETRFWQIMSGEVNNTEINLQALLPSHLHIFTIQQLPQNELDFLQRLSKYIDITLLHYNPSQLFWADIVDKQWLQRQQVINPESVFLRDYGHTLLSRLGKQSRETFAMLASLSGNEQHEGFELQWHDRFDVSDNINLAFDSHTESASSLSLLAHLQQDVLMLDESATQQATAGRVSAALGAQMALDLDDDTNNINSLSKNKADNKKKPKNIEPSENQWYSDDVLASKYNEQPRQWQLSQYDNSLSIHSCHNLQRQLEILRSMIGRWLNEPITKGKKRHLSDIVVLLPDVDRHHDLITSVFVNGKGQDGLTLPAKITGVVDKSIRQLWEAISGFYGLLGSETARFESAEVLDWLMLPPLYESLGLTHEQMRRGCDLLEQAGFVRGFDEAHLQYSLHTQDYDYRFSFAYALDQIALGLIMPEAGISDCLYPDNWKEDVLAEKTVPISSISLGDAPIVEALCRVHAGLNACRYEYQARYKAEDWLNRIESNIIHLYFGALDQTRPMRAIFNAMNGFKSSLRANRHYQRYHADSKNDVNIANDDVLAVGQVEAKLSQVSTLPLKLSFMLDSIEDELESQQVSAEPTGVITFGRFGALRNVPFGLVVMLNMDLSEFPNRDRDNRYDLMKAGLAKRGDRFSEDDDNGAFLDALLCARNACWIFYNGQRLTDTHEHLPANPVSELLQFLQGEIQWQWDPLKNAQKSFNIDNNLNSSAINDNNAALTAQVQRYLPKLIEQWLVTRHPALPFAEEVFITSEILSTQAATDSAEVSEQNFMQMLERAMQGEKLNQKQTNAPAKVWQDVFEHLQARDVENNQQPIKVNLPTKADYAVIAQRIQPNNDTNNDTDENFDVAHIDMQYLYLQVRHPARYFLKEQQVHIVLPAEDTVYQEPLSLSSLDAYTVNAQLLSGLYTATNDNSVVNENTNQQAAPINRLLYDPVMPAGVARQSTLNYQQLKITEQCREFSEELSSMGIQVNRHFTLDADDIDIESAEICLTLLTPCAEKMISVDAADMNIQGQINIKGSVPLALSAEKLSAEKSPELWLNILPNGARTQHLLRFWLAHVYWQVARRTTEAQVTANDGRSIWRFNKPSTEHAKYKGKTTFSLAPIAYETALAELLKWIRFAQIAGSTPMTILPMYAITYLDKVSDAQRKESVYQPKRGDFDSWLWSGYNSDMTYDTCSQHELWQYILQKQDGFTALTDALPVLAQPLFGAMNTALMPL